jgi:galactose-1-phosphate uridylyltransferase
MKIYVITVNYWNGERDSISVSDRAFYDKSKAEEFVNTQNAARKSAYWDSYDYEEVEVE